MTSARAPQDVRDNCFISLSGDLIRFLSPPFPALSVPLTPSLRRGVRMGSGVGGGLEGVGGEETTIYFFQMRCKSVITVTAKVAGFCG